LYEQFEGKARYKLFAIHSEVAFEEQVTAPHDWTPHRAGVPVVLTATVVCKQEQAFAPAGPDEVKVIIATSTSPPHPTLRCPLR
jgi:hypothetical protein